MINLVTIGGNLTDDPDLRDAANGALCAEFTLASKGVRFDRRQNADVIDQVFVRVVAWEDAAEVVARIGKGAVVLVTGQITQQEVEKNGRKERKTKVRALTVQVVRTPLEDRAATPAPAPAGDDQYPG